MSDVAQTVQQERAQWLKDLRADLASTERELEETGAKMAALRTKRDETKRLIRELEPRKPRNGDATGNDGQAVSTDEEGTK